MKATLRSMITVVGVGLLANLVAISAAGRLQAQCCSGPGYYSGPYSPPVYSYWGCSPPVLYSRGYGGLDYTRPYVDPPAVPQSGPYGWGSTRDRDRSFASDQRQLAPALAVPRGMPNRPRNVTPGDSHPHEHAEPRASVPSGPVAVGPGPHHSHGPAEPPTTVPSEPQAIAAVPALPPAPVDLQALAERQKICPVTGAKLGSMGKPVKVQVKGRDVLLCCHGCIDRFKSDPGKYLAKLTP